MACVQRLTGGPEAVADELYDAGEDGYEDDPHDHEREVLFDHGYVAEIVPAEYKDCYPDDTAGDVIEYETAVGHTAYACHERREGADYRHEPRDDDGFPSVLFIKLVGAVEVFPVQKPDVFLMKDLRPDKMAYPVIERVSRYRGHAQKAEQPPDLKRADG